MEKELSEVAYEYAENYGWRIVPLYGIKDNHVCTCQKNGDCPSAGKHPRVSKWQEAATNNPDEAFELFKKYPQSNLGVALGPGSGIIDIECDDEKAEELLFELFDGELPETPTFQANRGKHRLFKWSKDIPFQDKAVFKIQNTLEFRTGNAGGAQSVFPPSQHSSGVDYLWIIPPDQCDIEELPESVIAKLAAYEIEGDTFFSSGNSRSPEYWEELSKGVTEGGRNEACASYAGRLIYGLRDPFDEKIVNVTLEAVMIWNRQNKPPMPEDEVRTTFASILNRHRKNFMEGQATHRLPDGPELEEVAVELGPEEYEGWRLVELKSDPVQWRLYSPLWAKTTRDGYITLKTNEYDSVLLLKRVAMEEAGVYLPKSFKSFWIGGKSEPGAAEILFKNRTVCKASATEIMDCEVATILWNRIGQVKRDQGGYADQPSSEGRLTVLEDGTIWFQLHVLMADISFVSETVSRKRVLNILRRSGMIEVRREVSGQKKRYCVLNSESQKNIENTAIYMPEQEGVGSES